MVCAGPMEVGADGMKRQWGWQSIGGGRAEAAGATTANSHQALPRARRYPSNTEITPHIR